MGLAPKPFILCRARQVSVDADRPSSLTHLVLRSGNPTPTNSRCGTIANRPYAVPEPVKLAQASSACATEACLYSLQSTRSAQLPNGAFAESQ